MKVQVLGSAAGGGFPQWNCNCSNCYGIRNGGIRATPRSQSSIAVSTDNENWLLVNVSPDLRTQLEQFPEIQPHKGIRDTGIAAVILVDSQLEHCGGLLTLREGCPLDVYSTEQVYHSLTTDFPVFSVLEHWNGGLHWHPIESSRQPFSIGGMPALRFTGLPISGKTPPYVKEGTASSEAGHLALFIEDEITGASLLYAPALARIEATLDPYFCRADCVMVDGTFWREDEMIQAGISSVTADELGHVPLYGDNGMIEYLGKFARPRKIVTHINNTNPILIDNSPERHMLRTEGIEVAYDGMCIALDTQAEPHTGKLKAVL